MSANGGEGGGNAAARTDEQDDKKGLNNTNGGGDRVVIAAPATFDKETQEISDFIFLAEGGVSKPVVTTKKLHPIPTHVSSAPTLPLQVGISSSSSLNPTFAVVNAQEQSTPTSTSSTPTISRASASSASSSSSTDTSTPSTPKASTSSSIPPLKSKDRRRQGNAFDSFEGFVLTSDPDTIRQREEAAQRRRFERSKRLEEVVALVGEGLEEAACKAESDSSSSSSTTVSTSTSASASASASNLITSSTLQSRPSRHSKEDEFVRLLLLMEGDSSKLSNELFSFLFSLLLDNSIASKNSTTSTSRPLDFLYIFFKLLRKANYDNNLQVGLLKKLTAFVSKFTSVRVYAARNFWILHLLKFVISVENKPILDELFALIRLLGSFSISVFELKSMLRTMQNGGHLQTKTRHWAALLGTMQALSNREGGPDVCFDLSGEHCGIILPTLNWWPTDAYSFCCWIRLESFLDPVVLPSPFASGKPTSPRREYLPVLWSFGNEDEFGMDLVFVQNQLALVAKGGKGKRTLQVFNFNFDCRRWYFIAVSHVYHFIRRSEAALYVDSKLKCTIALTYPRVDPPVTRCFVGCNGEVQPQIRQPLRGQLGQIFFFQEAISESDLKAIFVLGPNMTPIYDRDFGRRASSILPPLLSLVGISKSHPYYLFSSGMLLTGQTESLFQITPKQSIKILMAYHPQATKQHLCIETAWGEQKARKTKGVREARTMGIKDALQCIGGIQVLFPLFSHLNPLSLLQQTSLYDDDGKTEVDSSLICLALSFVATMLSDSPSSLEAMLRCDGVHVLGLLFEKITPACWSKEAIAALEQLAHALSSNEPLFRQMFLSIYFNFNIWIYTDISVQVELMEVIAGHFKRQPQYFRSVITVQRIIDIMRRYYWFHPEPDSLGANNVINPSTGEIIGKRPEVSHIKKLRVTLLQLANALAQDGFNASEIRCMLLYLTNCPDHEQGVDVLQMLLALLNNSSRLKTNNSTCDNLIALSGLTPYIGLLKRKNHMLRAWSLKMIGKILEQSQGKRKEGLLGENCFATIKEYLQQYAFTEGTYYALMEVLLENVSVHAVKNPLSTEGVSPQLNGFKNPALLPTIFELLCIGAQPSLQFKALEDFSFLLRQSPTNRVMFLQQSHWQNWFLGLLASIQAPMGDGDSNSIFVLVVSIFTQLFYHSLFQANGYQNLFATQTLISHFGESGFFSPTYLMQQLNTSLLSVLASKGELLQACKSSPHIWENIFGWISFTEQCLFYNAQQQLSDNESSYTNTMDDPFLYGIRRRLDGMWEDFNFAQQLLDYLDSVLIALLTVKESHGRKLSNSASAADVKGYASQPGPANIREGSRIGLSSSSGVLHAPSPQNSGSISDDSESSLLRLMLRLTLYTLHETDAFMNTEAIQRRRNTVKDFETIIFESFETAEGLTVKEGMSAFLQEKSKLWNQEMASAQQTYQRNIKRLTQIVNRLIVLESESNRLLYVLNFLYKAMRRSYEQQGVGTELILGCFREVLVSCRFRLPLPVDTQPYNDEQLVNYVMTQLSFPSTGDTLALSHRFEEAVLRVINEEAAHRNLVYLRIEKDRQILTNEIKKSVQADQTAHSRFLSEYEYFLQTHAQDEFRRLSAVVQRFKHKQQLLERKWKYLNRSLFGPRAPWASSDEETEEKIANVLGFARGSNLTIPGLSSSLTPLIHWKLDQTEDMSRRHRRFKRNYSFDPHLGLTKRGIQPSSSRLISVSPQDNLPSVKLAPSALELEPTPSPSPAVTLFSLESSQSLQQVTPAVKGSHLALQTSQSNPNLSLDGSASASGTIPAPVPSIVPGGEKTLIKCMCELITPMKTTPGQLEITSENIYLSFDKSRASDNDSGHSHQHQTISNNPSQPAKNRIYKWPVTDVRVIYRRRYMLRNSAVELSLSDNTCYFLNFETEHEKVFKSIAGLIKQRVALDPRYELASGSVFDIVGGSTTKPTDIIKKSGLTDKWVKRKISTFDYLMQLNTIAGRTYNDLTQYPVFPWLIQDYTSPSLDLNDPKVYRDLSKPIGALNPVRLEQTLERYKFFDDPVIPKFHYGSHYSSVGTVLYYLVRMEPFTSYFLSMQGGKFDHANRMFYSIGRTWDGVLNNPSDVKELTPEFFYLPEFLVNHNNYDFGFENQDVPFGDVVLPPWADTPEDFVRIMREALESDYVSDNIHQWIDLIFGYKQRGKEAEAAHNIFFYLTYEGMVDIDSITDPVERDSVISQIINFGQTPSQLFTKPHPKRMASYETMKVRPRNPQEPYCYTVASGGADSIVFTGSFVDKLFFITSEGIVATNTFSMQADGRGLPFTFDLDKALSAKPRRVELFFSEDSEGGAIGGCFAINSAATLFFSAGHWDNSIKARLLSTHKVARAAIEHKDLVTCLGLGTDGKTLVSGSKDTTVIIWDYNFTSLTNSSLLSKTTNLLSTTSEPRTKLDVRRVLTGHDDVVTCVAVSTELDLVASGSKDRTVIVHTLQHGIYLRSIYHRDVVDIVTISKEGFLVSYCRGPSLLYLHSLNGKLLGLSKCTNKIFAIRISNDGKYVAAGGKGAIVTVSSIFDLKTIHQFEAPTTVYSLCFSIDDSYLIAGLGDGRITIFNFEPNKWNNSSNNNLTSSLS